MQRRKGFTLVELLVAMALILFIMAILSYAFVAATQSFRDLKATGDLAEKLRSVSGQLRRDLLADHFEGKKQLSDPNFWLAGPPQQGFFRIYQGSPSAYEGTDSDGIRSYRSVNHILHFTVKLRGNEEAEFFSASVPTGSPLLTPIFGPVEARYQGPAAYRYQWAEVAYFLRPSLNAQNVQDTANGTPLYTLYRRQRLAVPENGLVPTQPANLAKQYLEVSCGADLANPSNLFFNSPLDLTVLQRRFGIGLNGLPNTDVPGYGPSYPILAEDATDANLGGADLALTDVVSFDVRVILAKNQTYGGPTNPPNLFVDLYDTSVNVYDNGSGLFDTKAPKEPRVFDTWSSAPSTFAPLDYSTWSVPKSPKRIPMWNATKAVNQTFRGPIIKAIQITIRVWDVKTSLTRQITIIQAM